MSWHFWGKSVPHQILPYRPIHWVKFQRSHNLDTYFSKKIKMKSGGKRNTSLETSKFTFRFLKNCIFIISVSNKVFQRYWKQPNFVRWKYSAVSHTKKHTPEKETVAIRHPSSECSQFSPPKEHLVVVPSNHRIHVPHQALQRNNSNAAEETHPGTQPRVENQAPKLHFTQKRAVWLDPAPY